MKIPTTPTPLPGPATPVGIITQRQYDEYAANWVAASGDEVGTVLAQSFQVGKKQSLLASVRFPARQIARLVSTVGAAHIKARFLMKVDEKTQLPHFTVALFATDALNARISSYYIADEYWLLLEKALAAPNAAVAPAQSQPNTVRVLTRTDVPDVLSQLWVRAWSATTVATPPLFATTYGPLRGYTFDVDEFANVLRPVQLKNINTEYLLLEFALHEYYRAEPQGDVLIQTFGLLLLLQSHKIRGGDGAYVNMAKPCPPTC